MELHLEGDFDDPALLKWAGPATDTIASTLVSRLWQYIPLSSCSFNVGLIPAVERTGAEYSFRVGEVNTFPVYEVNDNSVY